MTLSNEIVTFAGVGNKFYERFADYHFHKSDAEWGRKLGDYDHSVSLNEKHEKVNEAFFAEVERLSNCARTADNMDAWMANPMVKWATMAIINTSVNAVLPAYVNSSLAPFVDFRSLGYGDVFKIKVMPRTLYTVSKGNKIAA